MLAAKPMRSIAGGLRTFMLREHLSGSLPVAPLALATVVSLGNSVILAIIYARVGGSHAYGIFQMAVATTGVVAVIAMSGAGTAATRAALRRYRCRFIADLSVKPLRSVGSTPVNPKKSVSSRR